MMYQSTPPSWLITTLRLWSAETKYGIQVGAVIAMRASDAPNRQYANRLKSIALM